MKLTVLLLCMGFILTVSAQDRDRIAGTVANSVTGIAIPNASIFLNGTSKGTISRSDGSFELTGIHSGNYELVVSSVGFQTTVINISSDNFPAILKVLLEPKPDELDSVVVIPYEKNGWKKWGREFIQGFIGTSEAAQDCVIKNHKVLRFLYGANSRKLDVTADGPLIIENKALGYRIVYQLESFRRDWKKRTVSFVGYSFFEEMESDKNSTRERWARNRDLAYKGSLMHFVRSLYNNSLVQDSFDVRRLRKVLNVEKQRIKKLYELENKKELVQGGRISFKEGKSKDTVNYFTQILQQEDSLALVGKYMLSADSIVTTGIDSTKTLFFPDYLQVTYRRAKEVKEYLYTYRIFRVPAYQRSLITLTPQIPIVIERNGLFFPPQNIFSSDYWGWSEKVSHMLPVDYQPGN